MSQGRHSEPGERPFAFVADHRRVESSTVATFEGSEVSVRVAYQGEPGAFSEAAVLRLLPGADPRPYPTFDEVFDAVHAGDVALGVVPVENSIGGSIHRNYDLLVERELSIVGEVQVPVVHQLLALPGVRLDEIRRVLSHPQALAQCARFLRSLNGVEAIATYDTAGSAKMVRDEQRRDQAAIASARAGELFSLTSLRAGIQDFDDNITRFLAISRERTPLAPPDKTSVVFTLRNEPGALFKALSVFALRGIDLSKLESRPVAGRPFEYLFYVDVAAAREDLACTRAMLHLAEFAASLRTLGSYPRWRKPEPAGETPAEPARTHEAAHEGGARASLDASRHIPQEGAHRG
jgi:prephenate dehydratase